MNVSRRGWGKVWHGKVRQGVVRQGEVFTIGEFNETGSGNIEERWSLQSI